MTLVFRNRLDPDNGRQIGPPVAPVQAVTTVTELKAALLVPGTYAVQPGLYVADLTVTTDDVHLVCSQGVIFRCTAPTAEAWTIRANNFSITGTWQVDCGNQLGMEIGSNTATQQSQQPDVVLLDGGTFLPFYFYTNGAQHGTATRAIAVHASHVTISDCRIEGFYRTDQECQAIWINNTNGPITIIDSFLEGAGENVLFGGDNVNIPNATPSDVYFARNTIYKRPSWRLGAPAPPLPVVKNIFELKNAQRVLIEDNVLDGVWAQGQSGNAFVFTVRNSASATSPWVIVNEVTVRHNVVRNNYEGGSFCVSILGHDDGGRTSQQTRTITIVNNSFEDCNNGVQVNSGVTDLLLIDHNTFNGNVSAELLQFANHGTLTTLQMTNNAGNQGAYGVLSVGTGAGVVANHFNVACVSGWICTGNILGRNQTQSVTWPSGNTVIGPASTPLALTAPPDCQLTGAQAGADCGWDGPAGVGLNGDGTTTTGAP